MAYEPKEGDISIFKNEYATGSQPEYRGTAIVNGQKMAVSLWVKEGSKGKFFAGKIKVDNYKKPANNPLPEDDQSNDLPF